MGLPLATHRGITYDLVLIVVDRSKIVKYIPCDAIITATTIGDLLIKYIFASFGAPRTIISDRGLILISQY
jgi:hypothetical protein